MASLGDRSPRFWPLALALALNVAALGGVYFVIDGRERAEAESEASRHAAAIFISIQQGLHANVAVLHALAGLFSAHPAATEAEFSVFVQAGKLQHHDVQALEWIPRVPSEERGAFEAEVAADHPGFAIHGLNGEPLVEKAVYHPVHYIVPRAGNEAAHGFDLSSSPARNKALEAARDTGNVVFTAPIKLIQESADQFGFLVFDAVFDPGVDPRTTAPLGYVLGVFRVDDMVHSQTANMEIVTPYWIVDHTDPDAPTVLYNHMGVDLPTGGTDHRLLELEVPGRRWALIIATESRTGWSRSQLVALIGLIYTLLLAAVFTNYHRRLLRDARQISGLAESVRARNAELSAAKNGLENRVRTRTAELAAANLAQARAAKELARSNRDLEEFAYAASHDLRAPLRGIQQLAEFIEEDLEDQLGEESATHLRLLRGRAARMDGLLRSLLEYARVGRDAAAPEQIDPTAYLQGIVSDLEIPPGATIDIRPMPHLAVAAVPFHQVFANLLDNALKHRDRDDITVVVTATTEGDYLEISVADDGAGIPEHLHDKAFKMFETLRARDDIEGSGMGLPMVRRILQELGGSIRLKSSPGRGAVFMVRLPIAPTQDS